MSTDPVGIAGVGNADQGILLGSANATVGGTDPQDDNVIVGNGAQGVWIEPGSSGNQVLGNQIGVLGPVEGFYFQLGNGAEGVLIQSTSNVIGDGAGNVISANQGDGVHVQGIDATRNLIESNYIGAAPGGGYIFGSGDPGNGGDGVFIDDAPNNQIGGGSASDGNVISSNVGNGVNVSGAAASGNSIINNTIGLIAGGSAVLGNGLNGVMDTAPGITIGPGNVISDNANGVLISGASATSVTVTGNLIGTDSSGENDLGNAQAGVVIDGATGAVIEGNGQGSQVISGNLRGVIINGSSATGNLVEGNFVGVDATGTAGWAIRMKAY